MFLQSFHTPGVAINSYLVGDVFSKRAVVIDPTRDVDPYLKCAQKEGLEITDIAETHVHADFASGARELKHRLQGRARIHCSAEGGAEWTPVYADIKVQNGDVINLGSVRLQALHTPGHTPEHIIWLCYDEARSRQTPCLAFTGDLLFVGSIGRPDLLGKEEIEELAKQLYHSLFVDLAHLPDFLEVYPAHGAGSLCGKGLSSRPSTTLGYERLYNPFLTQQPIEKWKKELLKEMPAAPVNFRRLKKVNIKGPALLSEAASTINGKSLIIDVRQPEVFAKEHFEGSVNIPFGGSFCNWAGSVITEDLPLEIVVDKPEQLGEVVKNLLLIGFDRIAKKQVWGENNKGNPLSTLTLVSVEELDQKIKNAGQSIFVLDVRTPGEWRAGHIGRRPSS